MSLIIACVTVAVVWVKRQMIISPLKSVSLSVTSNEHLGSPPGFGGVRVAHLSSFLCCVFSFVCLRPVSCVPNVVSLSGLSLL
jgi:hypothetical protein